MDRFRARRDRLQKLLGKTLAQAFLVTNYQNVSYLTGFTGDDSYLLLAGRKAIIISDPRYTTQLEEQCAGVELSIRSPGTGMTEAVAQLLKSAKVSRLAIEGESMTVALRERIESHVPNLQAVVTSGLVEGLREIKDFQEIEAIRNAVQVAEKAFGVLRATLHPEATEKQVADDLEHQLRRFGASGSSFPPIVAAGARAALPHAHPTDQKIGSADFVLVDWGATVGQYRSDLTRVLIRARISPKLERVYGVVLEAQRRAIAAIRPGVTGREVDRVARTVIADAGFGKNFGHGLGHGIGLDIHEGPRLSSTNEKPLKAGMVVTVEPGIYLPGWGGVRIEDDVLVTKSGCEVLTHVPKELEASIVH